MNTSSSETLLFLLRSALGSSTGEVVDLSAITKADWKALVDLAFDQGVAAIAVDGLQRSLELVPEPVKGKAESLELSLDSPELEDLKYEWFGEVFAREEDYHQQTEAIRRLVGLWSAKGLDTYVLKGMSLAQYYPIPEHRYCCDFDCNVRWKGDGHPAWDVADRLAKENGIAVDDGQSKHSRFVVGDLSVENHRHIIGVNGSRKAKRFDAYLQGLLNADGRSLLPGISLYSPCWLFNALFCVAHAKTHFLEEEGILLKHVLDWAVIRRDVSHSECRKQFEEDVDRFGLRKFFNAFDGVADLVEGGGFAHDNDDDDEKGVRRMLEDILAPKKVRHYESRFLAHLNILRMIWTNRWKFRLYSDTTALATMWRYVYGHFFDRDERWR